MFEFFANIFGYLLQFLYTLVNNYGLAIILFTLIINITVIYKTTKNNEEIFRITRKSKSDAV